ncbi:heme biosynthesis protein HemY [Halopseudomonas nanhaiensis]|uniref:heme biosynthesis HemY N-terminal domain-containing protein n=1 Tax=Halopseudomonas nanhaiensis TaxID=2830842 RepID=UPI001CBB29B9|nr:heme biosynthesis HemY N-terminal domain-containing protein [Halopseudomonas nanhaiensis]UAW98592.1 heme biosynthesis protein HemY [Halopseudomonas nanhaiensis]
MNKSYIAILVVLLLSALLGMAIAEDPGYLLIAWRNMSVETSIWVGLAVLIGLWLLFTLLRALTRLLRASGRRINPWSRHNRGRRANTAATRGLLEFAEGHWSQALRLLKRSAPHAEQPLINYLAAARAAHELEDYAESDGLLREAYDNTPKADVAIAVTQAQLQIARGQHEQALATLTRLRKDHPKHLYALKLMSQLYVRLEDWPRLQQLLPELRRHNVLSQAEQQVLEHQVYLALLSQAGQRAKQFDPPQPDPIDGVWNQVPKPMRQDPSLIEAYCLQLRSIGAEEPAEQTLRLALKQQFNDRLVHHYGLVQGKDPARQLNAAEKWLEEHPHDATLLLALGRLSLRNGLWGKARDYFEASFASKRDIQTCAELVRLLEHMGEHEAAEQMLRQGIALMVHDLPALPMPDRR